MLSLLFLLELDQSDLKIKIHTILNAKFEILIEIDCGEGRSGLGFEDQKILEISKIFSNCKMIIAPQKTMFIN